MDGRSVGPCQVSLEVAGAASEFAIRRAQGFCTDLDARAISDDVEPIRRRRLLWCVDCTLGCARDSSRGGTATPENLGLPGLSSPRIVAVGELPRAEKSGNYPRTTEHFATPASGDCKLFIGAGGDVEAFGP